MQHPVCPSLVGLLALCPALSVMVHGAVQTAVLHATAPAPPGGTEIWNFTTGGWVVSPALSPDGKTVYAGSDDASLYAVDAATGTQVWAFKTGYAVRSSPALSPDGKTVYVGSGDSNLYAVDAATGKQVWAFKTTDDALFSSPAPVSYTHLTLPTKA